MRAGRSTRAEILVAGDAIIWLRMSRELVDLVLEGYESWNRGDSAWVLDHMSPDVEWHTPSEDPDPGVFRGHRGVERFWAQWRELFGLISFRPIEAIDAGDAVVIVARRFGRGSASGVEVEEGSPGFQLRARRLRESCRALRPPSCARIDRRRAGSRGR
ncbi:MAG: nuclear transport factor 2 family protein [Thermoleophilaceae bacterium]|nr:nuclear transport factor 2 family protein [Thermoleophilaceae bacterium]